MEPEQATPEAQAGPEPQATPELRAAPEPYCDADRPTVPTRPAAEPGAAVADCVLCGAPTEHPAEQPGALLCPLCEWQQAQRGACSG